MLAGADGRGCVLDVAGGRGGLSFELALAGVRCTLVEEREAPPVLDRRQRKRLRRAAAFALQRERARRRPIPGAAGTL